MTSTDQHWSIYSDAAVPGLISVSLFDFSEPVCVLHTVLAPGNLRFIDFLYALTILVLRGSSKIVNSPNRGVGINPRDFTHNTCPR